MRTSLLNTFSLLLLLLFANQLQAQEELVKDINPGGGWSEFEYLFHLGDNFYFTANGDSGRELWISDGTPDGTEILLDINVGFIGSNPSQFVELNGTWLFSADNGVTGTELWKTDGTTAGTTILKDIHPGFPSSDISGMVNIGGQLYFQANNGTNGLELWMSDGTAAGTNMLSDLNPGVSSSSPEYMTSLGTDVYFSANDGTNGKEIWKTDGTVAGTSMVADIFTGADSSFPTNLTAVANSLYFTADDGLVGREIYKTDGTAAGTILQGDINPGISPSSATDLTAVGNYLFLSANDGTNGTELWRSDAGSPTPDLQMLELFAGAFSTLPSNFIKLNDDLIFNANDGTNGYELWIANASDGSVNLVKNISPNFNSSNPVMLDVLNNEVIFSAKDSAIGVELWKTDGTEAGTVLLGDLNPVLADSTNSFPQLPFIRAGIMYFTATDDINGWQIWRTDGTLSATQRLTDIPHDTIFNNSYKPYAVNSLGNTIINFVALGDAVGEELWKYSLDPVTIDDITSNSPLNCAGDADGTIDVQISGGVGDQSCYTYTWSDPAITGLSASNLSAGDYELTVTDCVGFTVTTTITIVEPTIIVPSASLLSDATCFGESDGSALVSPTGGISPYTYAWDNGETTDIATNLSAGAHQVTVTDSNNCTNIETINIGEPTAVVASAIAGFPVCFGGTDATATASGTGGSANYTFVWDNGETTATAVNLTGGDHSVTVTDMSGCSDVVIVSILTSTALEFEFITVDATCPGIPNGSASVNISGGSGIGYTYLWSTGSMTDQAGDLTGGTFSVTVTDSNACSATESIIVENPAVSITPLAAESCGGNADGQAEIVVTSTTGTYTYLWDNGETTAIATMLTAGQHTVTVTDISTCSFVEMLTIDGAAALTAASPVLTSPSCTGEQNGMAVYMPTGGTLPYTYTWSTGTVSNDGTLTDLFAATQYCVTITEAGNCSEFTDCFTLIEPSQITNTFQGETTPATCGDICDGTIEAVPMGGNAAGIYDFTWSTGETTIGAASSVANEICYGFTFVTITDGLCSVVDTFFNGTAPNALVVTTAETDVTCFGASDGQLDISVTGGVAPYTFDGPTADLPAGDYTVVVTDASGCSNSVQFQINQPEEITAGITTVDVTCNGGTDGSAVIIATGGTAPYTFTGPSGDLGAGTYSVQVTDANGCTLDTSFDINEPEAITATSSSTPEVFEDGTATVDAVMGGVAPYVFSWNTTPVQNTPIAVGLLSGDYECVITDANACTFTVSVMVDFLGAANQLDALSKFEILPNPAQSIATLDIEFDNAFDVRLDVFDVVGKLVQSNDYENLLSRKIDLDVSAFEQGVYTVRLSTLEGWTAKRLVVVL